MNAPKPVYNELLKLVQSKDYFVITTNVDHCFQKAGFDKKWLFYTQGDYGLFQYEKAKARVEELRSVKTARQAQADAIGAFMFEVQELDTLTKFDEKLWLIVIDTVTVHADGRMTFKFQGGTEIDA